MNNMEVNATQLRTPETNEETQHKQTVKPHVVIVGAGFGGLEAAKRLGEPSVEVTVIDRNNFHLFQPMLYQVATAGLAPDDICTPIREILRKQEHTEVLMDEVTDIDVQGQQVVTNTQRIPFDYLIVATGATSNYFGHDNWQQLAPGIKTLDDGLVVRNMV